MEFNSDFNAASAITQISSEQVETEDDLYQMEMEASREYSLTAKQESAKARDDNLAAAEHRRTAGYLNSSASISSGVVSANSARKMNNIDVMQDGSPAFKTRVNSLDKKIGDLKAQKALLGQQQVGGKKLSEVTSNDVQGWKNRRDTLNAELADPNLPPGQRQQKLQELNQINKDLGAYEKYQSVSADLTGAIQDRDRLVADEIQRLSGIVRMKGESGSQLVEGGIRSIATQMTYESDLDSLAADKHKEDQQWTSDQASRMTSLANQCQGTISNTISTATQMVAREGSATDRVTTYRG